MKISKNPQWKSIGYPVKNTMKYKWKSVGSPFGIQ
jgi:hypothetical protein